MKLRLLSLAVPAAAIAIGVAPVSAAPQHQPFARAATDTSGVVLNWYGITDQTVNDAGYPEPVTDSRAWDISWLAAARAVGDSTDPDYGVAAFAQALHDTLASLVPSQQSALDSDLASTLAKIPDGQAKTSGIAAGKQQASAALAQRQNDGLDTASVDTAYTPPPPGPSVWQPTPPSYGSAVRAGEGDAEPFLLAANDQFDPGPPPALSSTTYLRSLAETRAYGSADSSVRTAQQTDVAKFWEPAVNIQYVQIVRAVLADTDHPLAWTPASWPRFRWSPPTRRSRSTTPSTSTCSGAL
jgi:hypothetical protein